jgi:hypothetical protein
LIAKLDRFGVLANEGEAGAFERSVVHRLQVDADCHMAWRTAKAEVLPEPVDFILDFSERGAGRQMVKHAPHGVWFAAVGDRYRLDLEAALLENFATRELTVPLTLARWSASDEEAQVLVSWNMRPRRTRGRHVDAALRGIAECFGAACARVEVDALAGDRRVKPSFGSPPVSFARLIATNVYNLFEIAVTSFTLDIWNIGVCEGASVQSLFDPSFMDRVRWLPPDGGLAYRADPFGFRRNNGDVVIFHEAYDYRAGKGLIARAVGDRVSTVREFPVHAAYPYLFEHDGRRYCMPEQSESGGTKVFVVDDASLDLVDARVQLSDVPLIDGTVFAFEGLYWLFGTRADDNYNARLYAWYGETPLGPWRTHACNPIKVDITSARSAGTPFAFNGSLIRPAQDCSRTYGGAIVLNRITALSPTRFAEEPIGRIEPDRRSRYRDGVHTVSVSEGLIVIDGKYRAWHWSAPLLRIKLDRSSARRRQTMAGH